MKNKSLGSCKYANCRLGEWSEWSPQALAQGSCGQQQTRQRRYELSVAYQNHVGSCPSLPQTCPADIVEKREQCKEHHSCFLINYFYEVKD